MYHQLRLSQRPPQINLIQFILEVNLGELELSSRCGLWFEDEVDDLSPVRASLISTVSGHHFLIVSRPGMPETNVSVWADYEMAAGRETLTAQIEEFIDAVGLHTSDVSYRMDHP